MKVFATCNIGDSALDLLRKNGYELDVYPQTEAPPKSIIIEKLRSGVEGLITTLRDPIDKDVIAAGKGTLRVIATDAVGFDNIDVAYAAELGIPVTHTADVLTEATAEWAFFLLGSLSRRMPESETLVRENRWVGCHQFLPFLGREVTGKTVAVIGTGRIGKSFIKKCIGFDMCVLAYDPVFQDRGFIEQAQTVVGVRNRSGWNRFPQSIRYTDFDEAITRADYVSLHVPLIMPEEGEHATYHLMNADIFRRMKKTAFLVNTSRGPVVDEEALYSALKNGQIAGAALDVFEKEPLPANSPLRDPELYSKLRLYHHFGSGTVETRLDTNPAIGMAGRTVQGLRDVLERNYDGNVKKMPYVVRLES